MEHERLIEVAAAIRTGDSQDRMTTTLEYTARTDAGLDDLGDMIAATSSALWGYAGRRQLEPVEAAGELVGADDLPAWLTQARIAGDPLVQCLKCQAVFPEGESHDGCGALPTDRVRLWVDTREYRGVIDAWGDAAQREADEYLARVLGRPGTDERQARKQGRARADGVRMVLEELDNMPPGAQVLGGWTRVALKRRVAERLGNAWGHDAELDYHVLAGGVIQHMLTQGQLVQDGDVIRRGTL